MSSGPPVSDKDKMNPPSGFLDVSDHLLKSLFGEFLGFEVRRTIEVEHRAEYAGVGAYAVKRVFGATLFATWLPLHVPRSLQFQTLVY
jgi:hypothetical protein